MIRDSRFAIRDSRFTIHDSRFTIHDPPPDSQPHFTLQLFPSHPSLDGEQTAYFLSEITKTGLIAGGAGSAHRVRMTPEELRKRTKRFAIDVIRFTRRLPRTEEARVMGRQLLRSGTAVGSAYRAVCRPRSDADFIAKLGNAVEEADESGYWLELLVEAEIIEARAAATLHAEAEELTRIFVASRETARRNAKNRKRSNGRQSRIGN